MKRIHDKKCKFCRVRMISYSKKRQKVCQSCSEKFLGKKVENKEYEKMQSRLKRMCNE